MLSVWIARQLVRRPVAVIAITFGTSLLLSCLFLYCWISGYIDLKIDT